MWYGYLGAKSAVRRSLGPLKIVSSMCLRFQTLYKNTLLFYCINNLNKETEVITDANAFKI